MSWGHINKKLHNTTSMQENMMILEDFIFTSTPDNCFYKKHIDDTAS